MVVRIAGLALGLWLALMTAGGIGPVPIGAAYAASGGSSGASKPEKPRKPREDPRFMAIAPILVQSRDPDRQLRTVVLTVTLELEHRRDRQKVRQYMPRLRDAYLHDLSPPPLVDGRVDLAAAKEIMMRTSAKVLGPEVVLDVLIRRLHDSRAAS